MEPCGISAAVPIIGRRLLFLPARPEKAVQMNVKLYIGNLPKSTTDEELSTLFTQAGEVTLIDVIKDRDSGESKGFAFITMSTQSEAEKAIHMFNSYSLNEQELKVDMAKPKRNY